MRLALAIALSLFATACAAAQPSDRPSEPSDKIAVCGGLQGKDCKKDEWCDYPDGSACGAADQQGTCQPRPEVCTKIYQPVCGCDGRTYGNACEAHENGVDVSKEGEC